MAVSFNSTRSMVSARHAADELGLGAPSEVTIFSLIFEVVSAYGTVGLSLGNTRVSCPSCLSPAPILT